jgi:hypothetical protein
MDGKQFDQIAQEIIKQKQRMDTLQAENHDLRQQIADLRSGRGIFVDIYGSRFALRDDSFLEQANSTSSVSSNTSPLTPTIVTSTPSTTQPLYHESTTEIAKITDQIQAQNVKDQANNEAEQKSAGGKSTFLEEILLDEFNNALTSPNAVWQDPTEKKPSQQRRQSQ